MNTKERAKLIVLIRKQIDLGYKKMAMHKAMAAKQLTTYRPGDVFGLRDEIGRMNYWLVKDVLGHLNLKEDDMEAVVRARRCTKAGHPRSFASLHFSADRLVGATIIKKAKRGKKS